MSRFVSALFLGLLLVVAACGDDDTTTEDDPNTPSDTTGGDGDGDTTGGDGDGDTTGGDGDGDTTTGGDGDGDTTTGGDGDGDGDNDVGAQNLGVPCPDGTCPNGEQCISVTLDDDMDPNTPPAQITGSFCTIPCEGQMDQTTCSNMFPGPGVPLCALGSPDGFSCAVLCDTDQAPDCPTGTACIPIQGTQGICGPPV